MQRPGDADRGAPDHDVRRTSVRAPAHDAAEHRRGFQRRRDELQGRGVPARRRERTGSGALPDELRRRIERQSVRDGLRGPGRLGRDACPRHRAVRHRERPDADRRRTAGGLRVDVLGGCGELVPAGGTLLVPLGLRSLALRRQPSPGRGCRCGHVPARGGRRRRSRRNARRGRRGERSGRNARRRDGRRGP